ncbi:hypothetical protein KM043_009646 [Ampulex compressa]|nr:hypothetical protein KM043_009646 [Ampulex compressa]
MEGPPRGRWTAAARAEVQGNKSHGEEWRDRGRGGGVSTTWQSDGNVGARNTATVPCTAGDGVGGHVEHMQPPWKARQPVIMVVSNDGEALRARKLDAGISLAEKEKYTCPAETGQPRARAKLRCKLHGPSTDGGKKAGADFSKKAPIQAATVYRPFEFLYGMIELWF